MEVITKKQIPLLAKEVAKMAASDESREWSMAFSKDWQGKRCITIRVSDYGSYKADTVLEALIVNNTRRCVLSLRSIILDRITSMKETVHGDEQA